MYTTSNPKKKVSERMIFQLIRRSLLAKISGGLCYAHSINHFDDIGLIVSY